MTHHSNSEKRAPWFIKPLIVGLDIIILLVVTVLYSIASDSSGDKSTALGFLSLVLFLFISIPLMGVVIGLSFTPHIRTKTLSLYLIISVTAHGLVALQLGFFDKTLNKLEEKRIRKADPALYTLRQAISLGPTSNIDKVKKALKSGANPNASYSNDNAMPLILLPASRADYAAIQALIEAGANPNVKSNMQMNNLESPYPIDLVLLADAKLDSALLSLKILRDAGATTETPYLSLGACHRGQQDLYLEFISSHTVEAEAQTDFSTDKKDNNCLHYALENSQIEFIRWLLESEATQATARKMLNSPNKYGQLPLDLAVTRQKIDIAQLFLEHGALTNKKKSKQILNQQFNQTQPLPSTESSPRSSSLQ